MVNTRVERGVITSSGKTHVLFDEFNRYTPVIHLLTSLSMSSTLRASLSMEWTNSVSPEGT
jgi:hypothetical protein